MTAMDIITSTHVSDVLSKVRSFSTNERLILAKLILDSLVDPSEEETDWLKMSLSSFEKDWDNPDDAIYDNWREEYGIPAR